MKDKIISHLKMHMREFTSGEELSRCFGVSRNYINKLVKSLKEDGYVIECKPNAGYQLTSDADILNHMELKPLLKTHLIGSEILCFNEISSTNTYAKENISRLQDGTVIVTENQTSGRGRRGRNWFSMPRKNLYFSLVLKPNNIPMISASIITMLASVAIVKALTQISGVDIGIKWPNDLYIENKKICGILVEMGGEAPFAEHIVIGAGININIDINDIPTDIHSTATSLKIRSNREFDRKEILAEILNIMDFYYNSFLYEPDFYKQVLEEYKEASIVLHRDILVFTGNAFETEGISAYGLDISDEGFLIVRMPSGEIRRLSSGEVSVRNI